MLKGKAMVLQSNESNVARTVVTMAAVMGWVMYPEQIRCETLNVSRNVHWNKTATNSRPSSS